jgi:simple sugar transport system ATP-binding protein
MSGLTFLRLEGISKYFGAIHALNNISLSIDEKEVIGIVGDNAAGKSTLMKIISGAYRPDKGKMFIKNKEVHWHGPIDARNQGIEMIYQDFALIQELDVSTNIFLGREIIQKMLGFIVLNKKEMRRKSLSMINSLGLPVPPPTTRVSDLSGGQQQAVAIARATGFKARLVIMDEPTANLSPGAIEHVREAIRRLKNQGISVIIVSHRLEDILATSDRIIVMKQGSIVGERDSRLTCKEEILAMIITGIDKKDI